MRLVCPNCAATYEVPEDAIPDTGRDVQCASCGHAWFFARPETEFVLPEAAPVSVPDDLAEPAPAPIPEATSAPAPDAALDAETAETAPAPADKAAKAAPATDPQPADMDAEAALARALADEPPLDAPPEVLSSDVAAPEADTDTPDATRQSPEPEAVSDKTADDEDPEDGLEDDPDQPFTPDPTPPAGYAMDEGVLTILREEAEREAMARRGMAVPLESQPDLGVEAAMPDRATAAALAALDPADDARPAARRDLLPDVEEINSTLRPTETNAEPGADVVVSGDRQGGFRSGFLMVMTLSLIATGIYALEPRISAMIPALSDPLDLYVGGVDALRLALDGVMRSATVALNGG